MYDFICPFSEAASARCEIAFVKRRRRRRRRCGTRDGVVISRADRGNVAKLRAKECKRSARRAFVDRRSSRRNANVRSRRREGILFFTREMCGMRLAALFLQNYARMHVLLAFFYVGHLTFIPTFSVHKLYESDFPSTK